MGCMFQLQPPPPDLARWVEGGVAIELGPEAGVSRFPALPHAMLTLRMVAPGGDARRGLTLCPPITFHSLSTRPTAHTHGPHWMALGWLVRPAAAACLLGHAGGVAADQVHGWRDVAGDAEGARLEDEVQQAPTSAARLQAMAASLRRAMARAVGRSAQGRDEAHARLCLAVGSEGAQAGALLGLGPRQLQRHCLATLGVAPKQFQRLVRFNHALALAGGSAPARLAQVAADAGYFDQSHLGRETRQLLGAPLRDVLPAARPDQPWWPLATGQAWRALARPPATV
jgi:AraC-like DNA-binding protein